MDNKTQYYCIVQVGVNDTFQQSAYVIPGTTTSENVTVLAEGTCTYVYCISMSLCSVADPEKQYRVGQASRGMLPQETFEI